MILHPYQSKAKVGVYNYWNCGYQNVLAVIPTGGGKTVLFADIVFDGVQEGLRQAVIAHRNELVSQMSVHLARRGIMHRVIGAKETIAQITRIHREMFGKSFVNPTAPTAVVGVDTLIARKEDLAEWAAQIHRWVVDEAHHVLRENKWGKAVEMFPYAKGLGVTATPWRTDGHGLGRHTDGVFDTMYIGPTMRFLIENSFLADYEIVCPESDLLVSDEDVGASGDWGNKKLRAAAEKSKIVGDVVENYIKFANGKLAICFATDVKTGHEIADKFNAAGIRSVCLSGDTKTSVREKYVRDFREGKIRVLVNVDLFDEGFDVPACEVVIMARPTTSLGKYRQMVGRALRTAANKLFGLIIDHVGNVKRHGLPDKYVAWSLDRRDKRSRKTPDPDDIPLTVCKNPDCARPYERSFPACPYCGSVPKLPAPRERTIDMVDGDLILLDREALEKMRQQTVLEDPASLGERVAKAAGNAAAKSQENHQIAKIQAQNALKDAIAQWAGIERAKGRSDQESYRRFYLATGVDVMSAMAADNTRQDYEKLTEIVKGWWM